MSEVLTKTDRIYTQTLPPLSRTEEVDLIRRWQEHGDEEARERLVRANIRFVVRVAAEYQSGTLSLAELAAEGMLGLLEAIDRFDASRGFKLITYAVWWIRQAIRGALPRLTHLIRQPTSLTALESQVVEAVRVLEQERAREVSYEDALESLDVAPLSREALPVWRHTVLSLDAPLTEEEQSEHRIDLWVSEECDLLQGCIDDDLRSRLWEHIRRLTPREQQILICYYGLEDAEPVTLEGIGRQLSLTRERVRQLRNAALLKLTKSLRHEQAMEEAKQL